jgi:hypothetical protein
MKRKGDRGIGHKEKIQRNPGVDNSNPENPDC